MILTFKHKSQPIFRCFSVALGRDRTFIRSGHRDADEFEEDSLRTIWISEEEGIKAVIGKPKGKDTTEVVSYLFLKEKCWNLEKRKKAI